MTKTRFTVKKKKRLKARNRRMDITLDFLANDTV